MAHQLYTPLNIFSYFTATPNENESMHPQQVSEPPKKLLKWRKKLAKPKNALNLILPGAGRNVTMLNFAFKAPKHPHALT